MDARLTMAGMTTLGMDFRLIEDVGNNSDADGFLPKAGREQEEVIAPFPIHSPL
jgi:hypothetical protein